MFFALAIVLIFSYSRASGAMLNLDEGEVCKRESKGNWICKYADDCHHTNLKTLQPPVCSFDGHDPIVCCPPSKKRSKAEIECQKYQASIGCLVTTTTTTLRPEERRESLNAEIGFPSISSQANSGNSSESSSSEDSSFEDGSSEEGEYFPLVLGGTESRPKSHPEAVLLGSGPENDITWQCGGSLISNKWILSAAHCEFPHSDGIPMQWVLLGDLDRSSDKEDAKPVLRKIIRTIHHPKFKLPSIYHDIALFEMDSVVPYSEYIAPVCLQSNYDIASEKATVVGWGRTGFAEDVSSKLLQADITLVNHTECFRLFGSDSTVPKGVDRRAMLCAGEREGGKDACKGDSGSPLVVKEKTGCETRQVGVVSTGRDCGLPNMPGIYTRVSTYVPWIESVVWP